MRVKKRKILWKKGHWMILAIILVLVVGGWYGTTKKLPDGISVESQWVKSDEIEFLFDLTYRVDNETFHEQRIFESIVNAIEEAEEFIVVDMFLFNDDYDRKYEFPQLSMDIANLIAKKKNENPDMKIVVITDEINTFYGVYKSKSILLLEKANVPVIITNLDELRNSNSSYSSLYGLLFKWLKTNGRGWIRNPFSKDSPEVTLRSLLRMANFKANHRKTIVTEKRAIVSSANPHDASSNHSNIAFSVSGEIQGEILATELAVMRFSGYESDINFVNKNIDGKYDIKLITEGKIREKLVESINTTNSGDEIVMGMFYLAERSVINSLIEASDRGVDVKLILDANKDAFGMEKIGIPNRPVASELMIKSDNAINIRWYETHGEQFHTKLTEIKFKDKGETLIFGGSANLTRRNIKDYNLETDVMIRAESSTPLIGEVDRYFERIWNNFDGKYTLDYEEFSEDMVWKKVIYRIQEFTGLSTF